MDPEISVVHWALGGEPPIFSPLMHPVINTSIHILRIRDDDHFACGHINGFDDRIDHVVNGA